MTPEDVRQAVRDVLKEERNEFWVCQPQHYTDHEWIREIRVMFCQARRAGMVVTIATILAAIFTVIWVGVKAVAKQ
jgi:hypothetical protein